MCMYISVCICIRLYSKTRGWRPESKFLIEIDKEKKGKKKAHLLSKKETEILNSLLKAEEAGSTGSL